MGKKYTQLLEREAESQIRLKIWVPLKIMELQKIISRKQMVSDGFSTKITEVSRDQLVWRHCCGRPLPGAAGWCTPVPLILHPSPCTNSPEITGAVTICHRDTSHERPCTPPICRCPTWGNPEVALAQS